MAIFGKKAPKSGEPALYHVFLAGAPPMNLVSTVNLLDIWIQQLEERNKNNEWWRPIEFVDEDGRVTARFTSGSITGIVVGAPIPKEKQDEQGNEQHKPSGRTEGSHSAP